MKENEIRIGNFVFAKTTGDEFNIISEIGKSGNIGHGWYVRLEKVNHGVWLEHDGISMINGVEITAEWLHKLGFQKTNNAYALSIGTLELVYMDGVFKSLEHIKFIHQIQNLYFALTGTELNIL